MMRYARIFISAAKSNIAAMLAYRTDCIVGMIILVISELLLPLLTALVYNAGMAYPGWSYYEALLMQSIFMMSRGASYSLFFGMSGFVMSTVREGTFDLVMIRPVPAAFLSVMLSLNLEDAVVFFSGAIIFMISAAKAQVVFTLAGTAWLVILLISGITVMLGFTLLMSATMFKWVGNSRIFEIFESIAGLGRYPSVIFPGIFRILVTYVLPVAMIGSLPAEVFLGKRATDPMQLLLIMLCCAGFLLTGYIVWRMMIRSYISSGG
jgi:ABC-2 type transport system permease protein